jgi:hypothetical protein
MRVSPTFLLLLMLPGLLLPAGLLLRLCRCAEAAVAVASCCAVRGPSQAQACCAAHEPTAAADARSAPGERGDVPVAASTRPCGCVWIAPNEHKPDPAPPDVVAPAAPPLLPIAAVAVPPSAARPSHHTPPAEPARPPPPDRRRNLPLRL